MGSGSGGGPGSEKLENGQRCSNGSACVSGHCVDGVCCESTCGDACTTCAAAGAEGLCRPAAAGLPDPRSICADTGAANCGTNGLCDVSGHCARYSIGTTCAAPRCKNGGMLTPMATCDGAGTCRDQPAIKCAAGCAEGSCL